jgi:hypothetical protein
MLLLLFLYVVLLISRVEACLRRAIISQAQEVASDSNSNRDGDV